MEEYLKQTTSAVPLCYLACHMFNDVSNLSALSSKMDSFPNFSTTLDHIIMKIVDFFNSHIWNICQKGKTHEEMIRYQI
jgi:hypothetical protein